jgi:O-antigen/teichoic acid export membrane protein
MTSFPVTPHFENYPPLRKNIFWALVANGATAGFSWLMLMVLTKVAGAAEVGLFALAQAVALPVHTFFTFKLRVVQATDHTAEFSDDEYKNFRILSGILNFLVAAVLSLFLYKGSTYVLIIILSLSYSIVIYREFYVSVLQKHERNDRITFSNIAQGLLALVLFVCGFLVTRDLKVGMAGILISRILCVLAVDRRLSRPFGSWGKHTFYVSIREGAIRRRLNALFRIGIPMGGVALLSTLFASIPRLVLDKAVSTEAVGFYSALSSLVVVMSLFINSLAQSITPRLALIYMENKRDFANKIKKLILLSIGFVLACLAVSWFFGKTILTLAFTREYAAFNSSFFKLMIGGGILVLFSVMIIAITAQRSFRIQLPIYVLCTLVTLVSSIFLIPRLGIDGAVYSFALCNITGFLLSYIVYSRNMGQNSAAA